MSITNGDFEDGLTGWTTTLTGGAQGGQATIVASTFSLQNPPSGGNTVKFYWYPQSGSNFLKIKTGPTNVWQTVTQTITVLEGTILSGKAAFDWNDTYTSAGAGLTADEARVQIYQGTGISGTVQASPFYWTGASIDPATGVRVANYWNGPWTDWATAALPAGTYTIELGVKNIGDNRDDSFGYFDSVIETLSILPLPNLKIGIKKFQLSRDIQNPLKIDDKVEVVNSALSVVFPSFRTPVTLITGSDCLIPNKPLQATVSVSNPNSTATLLQVEYDTYIGGTGKKIIVGTSFESLYEPSILYRKDKGATQAGNKRGRIRIEKISALVQNSRELGMRKSGKGITTSIEYNTSENLLGTKWNFYFKDDLRNAKMEFIMSDHRDVQITQFIWQGQYHQVANKLGGR